MYFLFLQILSKLGDNIKIVFMNELLGSNHMEQMDSQDQSLILLLTQAH